MINPTSYFPLVFALFLSLSACANSSSESYTSDGQHRFQAEILAVSLDSAATKLSYTPVTAQLQTDTVSGYPYYHASDLSWQPGQQFQISADQTPPYLYMFSVDAKNTVRIHYAPNSENKPVTPNNPLVLPTDSQGFTVAHTGTEYFCMLYTTALIPQYQQLIEGLEMTRGTMMQRIVNQFGKWLVPLNPQLAYNPQSIGFNAQLPQPDSTLQIIPLVYRLNIAQKSPPPRPNPPKTDTNPVRMSVLGIGIETPFSKFNRQSVAQFMQPFTKVPSNALFSEIRTDTLCGNNLQAKTILQTINDAIEVPDLSSDDLFVLYIAGNAYYNKNNELCLFTGNKSGIRYQEIANLLATIGCRKMVFLQNGMGKVSGNRSSANKPEGMWEVPTDSLPPLPPVADAKLLLINSNEPLAMSYDNPTLKQSIFVQAISEAYQGKADTDKNHQLTSTELIAYLNKQIPQLALQLKHKQTPVISSGKFSEMTVW